MKQRKQQGQYILYSGTFYHPTYFIQREACLKLANYTYAHCGRKRGEAYETKSGIIDRIILQVAHVNHDPKNPHAELIALCKACHMKYDSYPHWRTRRRKAYERERAAGQLELPW